MSLIADIVQFPFRSRQKTARKQRLRVTKDVFVQDLAENELEERAAACIWDLLVESATVPDFRPVVDDDFLWMYGLAEEDLDQDLILEVFRRIDVPLPQEDVVNDVGAITSPRILIGLIRKAACADTRQIERDNI